MAIERLKPEWRVCNCANCRTLLLGESMRAELGNSPPMALEYVGGRFLGRPYCAGCLPRVNVVGAAEVRVGKNRKTRLPVAG